MTQIIPKNLNELNDNFLTHMDLFLTANWINVPKSFIVSISDYIDSCLINVICVNGQTIAESFITQYDLTKIDNANQAELLKAVKSYGDTSKITKSINDSSIFSNNSFYDKEIVKLKTYINRIFSKDELIAMTPNKKQSTDFNGFDPEGICWDFNSVIDNGAMISRNERQYIDFYEMLSNAIFGYKMFAYYDIQTSSVIEYIQKNKIEIKSEDILLALKETTLNKL